MVTIKATWILLFLVWNVRSEFVCPRSRGYFPDPVCCNRYYVCMHYESSLETCPDQMLFDIRKRNCFTRSKVDCGDRIPCNEKSIYNITEETTYNITEGTTYNITVEANYSTTVQTDYNRTEVTAYNTTEVTTYNITVEADYNTTEETAYNTTKETAYNKTEETTYNTTEEADYNTTAQPAYNITDNTIISENTNFTKIPSDFDVTTTEQENATMNEFDILTSEYIKIDNTTSSIQDINYTVIIITADDKSTHTTESTHHQPETTPKETTTFDDYYSYEDLLTCPEAYGLFPHPTEKNKYLHCQNWFPHVLSCPADLLFDKNKKVCAWIQRKN